MTIVGFILFLGGLIIGGMIFLGTAPAALAGLQVPIWVWFVVAAFGGLLIMLNRRPGN